MRTLIVLGTRPEVIKLAPVAWALDSLGPEHTCEVVLTGQHGEVAHTLADELGMPVDLDLGIRADSPGVLLSRTMEALDAVLAERQPDVVVVQGDTASTLAGALAAFYRQIPVAHVEAGLRTYDLASPFPEEGNRRAVAAVASLHLAPTAIAAERLLAEGISTDAVLTVGNTVVDAVRTVAADHAITPSRGRMRAIVTLHRRESWGDTFDQLCLAMSDLLEMRPELDIVFVMHPNPALQTAVRQHLGDSGRARLEQPMGYRSFVSLLQSADVVLTDSGGVQEEAVALGKPLIVLRERTERPEGVSAGAILAGVSRERIPTAVDEALSAGPVIDRDLYGRGDSAEQIADALLARFDNVATRQLGVLVA